MDGGKFDLCGQVKERILVMIGRMDLQQNRKLPGEKELAQTLQVSRNTVRAVLATLEGEGRIFRRHGSGTYVNPEAFKISATLFPQVYFGDLIRRSGYAPQIEPLGARVIRAGKLGTTLGVKPDGLVAEIKKLYSGDGKKCIYCVDYISCGLLTPDLVKKLKTEPISIFNFLLKYTGRSAAWEMTRIEATDSKKTPALSGLIAAPGDIRPFLLLHSTYYDASDLPVLHSLSYVDTELLPFYLVRGRCAAEPSPGAD